MKNKVSNLFKHWYLYLLGIGASIGLLFYVVGIRTKPGDTERIYYYVCSYGVNGNKLKEETEKVKTNEIREVMINFRDWNNEDDSYKLLSMVYDYFDIFIYPETMLKNFVNIAIYYSKEEINEYIPNSKNYPLAFDESKNQYYGIKIYDKETDKGICSDLFTFKNDNKKQDFYISFAKTSYHNGKLKDSCTSSNNFKVVDHLLGL